MKIQAIAHSYWRSVKAGNRTFNSITTEPRNGYPSMSDQVLYLAKTDVVNGVITIEEFLQYTGLIYSE